MRITFVIPIPTIAGGVRVAAIYARHLTDLGHDVTVVSPGGPGATQLQKLRRKLRPAHRRARGKPRTTTLDFLGDKHIRLGHPFPMQPDEIPDADVIIATWWETAFAVSAMPPEKGHKVYFIQHHEVHDHLPWHLSHGSYHLPLKKVTISQWLVDTMSERYGDTDVDLVENSVDMQQFRAPERGRQARPTVGLLYAVNPFKGVDISLAAIERARTRMPDLQVVAFGAKDIDPSLPLPPGSQYFKNPDQEKLRDIYASCDVWLCGSRAEGFHLPPSEAMACRCPVVSTAIGGAVEIVTEGVNGYIVPVEDSIALGDRLADVLCASPQEWKAMSDAAFARAESYTWEAATQKFLKAISPSS